MRELFSSMKYIVLLSAILLTATSSAYIKRFNSYPTSSGESLVPAIQQTTIDSTLQYLLTSTVNDFHTQRPSDSIRFRDVHFGHNKVTSGNNLYMLCGKFHSFNRGKPEWIPFVTIKTSGYELYIGETTYCQKFIQDNKSDLSKVLQDKFDTKFRPKT
jgi:hypothetical protein